VLATKQWCPLLFIVLCVIFMLSVNFILKVLYICLDFKVRVVWSFGNPFCFYLQGRKLWPQSSSKLSNF
jgi:hypothetical protein